MYYDPERDWPRGDCVVAAIDRFVAMRRDKAAAPRDRLEALKFVVHFVADVHQPRTAPMTPMTAIAAAMTSA